MIAVSLAQFPVGLRATGDRLVGRAEPA
jgi:hypothetical protein